jgi:hypothetical protein
MVAINPDRYPANKALIYPLLDDILGTMIDSSGSEVMDEQNGSMDASPVVNPTPLLSTRYRGVYRVEL